MKWNIIKTRGVISTLLLITFFIIIFTGIGLYLAPSGRIARETNWTFLGFNRFKLENLHTNIGFVMTALVIIHLIINYKIYINEVKALLK